MDEDKNRIICLDDIRSSDESNLLCSYICTQYDDYCYLQNKELIRSYILLGYIHSSMKV